MCNSGIVEPLPMVLPEVREPEEKGRGMRGMYEVVRRMGERMREGGRVAL